jgi:hypothetical protein
METMEKPAIGQPLPGYAWGVVKPVIRLDSWGPVAVRLEPFDGSDLWIGTADGRHRVYPDWSATPEYVVTAPHTMRRLLVRVEITGRTRRRWLGGYWVRGRVEFCRDGESSEFAPCWLLSE